MPASIRYVLSAGAAALLACLALAVFTAPRAHAAETRILKIEASWPESLTFYDNFTYWAGQVEVLSGGSLRVERLPSGQVVAPTDLLDATNKKIIDGAHTWAGYWRDREYRH